MISHPSPKPIKTYPSCHSKLRFPKIGVLQVTMAFNTKSCLSIDLDDFWGVPYFKHVQTYGCVWKCCVPLNPMVLLIIIPMKNGYFIGNIPYFQTYGKKKHGGLFKIWGYPHILTNRPTSWGCIHPTELRNAATEPVGPAPAGPVGDLVMYSNGISNKIWQEIVYIGMNIEF